MRRAGSAVVRHDLTPSKCLRMLPLYIPLVVALLVTDAALGQTLNAQREALQIIADFADRLCFKIPLEGTGGTIDLSGAAKAELDTVLKRVVQLGIQGSAKYQQSQFQGLLQRDLLTAVKTSTDCKLKVFDTLKDRLLPAARSESPTPMAPEITAIANGSRPDTDGLIITELILTSNVAIQPPVAIDLDFDRPICCVEVTPRPKPAALLGGGSSWNGTRATATLPNLGISPTMLWLVAVKSQHAATLVSEPRLRIRY